MYQQAVDFLTQLASRLPASNQRSAAHAASRKGKKNAKKASQRCQQQVATCEPIFSSLCNGDQACIAERVPCCALLSTCDFNAFLVCIGN